MRSFPVKTILILTVISAFLVGCIPETACTPNALNATFIGFSAADIDTIILRAYEPNDNYQHLIDTILVDPHTRFYTTMHDTTIMYVNESSQYNGLTAGFDWQIYIPAQKRTVLISNIMSDVRSEHLKSCTNPIISFVQDGQVMYPQLIKTGYLYTTGYRAYIYN